MVDKSTQGWVIVHKETGERRGSCYASTGGAKNSYNAAYSVGWRREPKFNDQSEYVLKRLVIADD